MRPIKEKDRRYWDVFVFAVILLATFIIPYEILVGFENAFLKESFDLIFYIVYGIDIILNLFTEQPVYDKTSGTYTMTTSIKESYQKYLKSIWFFIDLLAIFPFDFLLSSLGFLNISRTARFARLPRLFRVFRALRGVKGVYLLSKIAQAWKINPSYTRFLVMFILVPWICHVLACFYHYYESSTGISYTESLSLISDSFIKKSMPQFHFKAGKTIAYIAIISGYLFMGAFIGNFASMFDRIDARKAHLLDSYQRWQSIFKKHPEAFNSVLKKQILQNAKDRIMLERVNEEEILISELPNKLESEVRMRINKVHNKTQVKS